MTDAYDAYQEVLSKANKEENGYLPADLFNKYARSASRFVFNDYNSRLQNPNIAAVEKLKLEDRLATFERMMSIPAADGLFTVPADAAYFHNARMRSDGGYGVVQIFALQAQLCEAETDPTINVAEVQHQLDELYSVKTMSDIQLLDHDQVAKRTRSFVPGKKPTTDKPIMERTTLNGVKGFQIYPNINASVFYSYYRRPVFANLVMTPDPVTQELKYDKAASTAFEWDEEAMTDIVNKIVIDFATYLREQELYQMAQAEQKP